MINNWTIKSIKDISQNIILSDFNCIPDNLNIGKYSNPKKDYELINEFLTNNALDYAVRDIMQTFIFISKKNNKIIGYFSLSAGSKRVYNSFKKNKDNVPTIGRNTELPTVDMIWFAIDHEFQRLGFGEVMMQQIFKMVNHISLEIGICLFTVDSIRDSQSYYRKYGFLDVNDGTGNIKGDKFMAIQTKEVIQLLKSK
ncbi:GNAT family N-acetyltransferase [Companilactobacillus hulinensis]|uniref:GNAT family N-acetyltransferase n=1 Tax=Companilactobacillus hulinensis TaxID=2486007 RepID=UPI000F76FF6B|nr:GNAT family N-acetyltransferase [Companilactobacillus hulinensis]